MTLFLSFRSDRRAGTVLPDPLILEVDGGVKDPVIRAVLPRFPDLAGREAVFATHGFNLDLTQGTHALARLETELRLPPPFLLVGVLWPGDWWVPVINYPSEADDAVQCGWYLARFIRDQVGPGSLSFVSHSLGARVVLEAVKRLKPIRRAREVCVLAAAADDDCLTTDQYEDARTNARRTSVLASRGDWVLELAYPAGDFVSDALYDDDSPWRKALGYHGPRPFPDQYALHAQIPGREYGHWDYFPPDDLKQQIDLQAQPIQWVREALLDLPHFWP